MKQIRDLILRDDIFDLKAVGYTLLFPDDTPSEKGDIRIKTSCKRVETVFDKQHRHEKPRYIAGIIKRSEMAQYYVTRDRDGNILPDDDPFYDIAFPPKAWMTDSTEDAKLYAEKNFPLDDFHLDPGLERYSEWLKMQKGKPVSPEAIEKAAREIAMTTAKPLDDYDRNRCYTPVAMSVTEMRLNMERSRKRTSD